MKSCSHQGQRGVCECRKRLPWRRAISSQGWRRGMQSLEGCFAVGRMRAFHCSGRRARHLWEAAKSALPPIRQGNPEFPGVIRSDATLLHNFAAEESDSGESPVPFDLPRE
ncbi:hypothetical protein CEXT_89951 [Caerostris extrusa]|uniref:Uncharacterized protein n=1 Tax=Caerostris extrusa TaxID=172846 RepID=A0AAV4WRS8_CAEEX|nr:hypothetical protein CEXT_89951 [Caerostris extrusa]